MSDKVYRLTGHCLSLLLSDRTSARTVLGPVVQSKFSKITTMAGRETYDVSPSERAIAEHRAKRRQMLRNKYLEETLNPYRQAQSCGGYVDDISVNRYSAMRSTATEFFKPTWKNSAWLTLFSIIPIVSMVWITKKLRDKNEDLLRTGQVSYRDREFKFV